MADLKPDAVIIVATEEKIKFKFSGGTCAAPAGYHAAHIGTLIWYFLNGAFGSFDLSCSPHSCASALSWHSPSKPASSLVWLIANTQTRPAIAVFRQFSKQDLLPPCSINKIHKTLYSIRSMVAGWGGT